MAKLVVALLLLLASGHSIRAAEKSPRVLFDFDAPGAMKPFAASGKIEVAASEIPQAPPRSDRAPPAQRAARFKAQANSAFYTKPEQLSVDWAKQQELSFWVYLAKQTPAGEANKSAILEIRLQEEDGRAWFWRKVIVPPTGWSEIRLPLAWFRVGGGRVPEWNNVSRLVIAFRSDAEIWIDTISVAPGSPTQNVAQLRELAFGRAAAKEVRVVDDEDLLLLTNAPDLDTTALADHLRKVNAAVRRDLPFLPEPKTRPTLIVFATRGEYENFTPRFAKELGGEAAPPKSGGFTVEGIATSFWDPAQGSLRPVYTHEYVHSLLHHLMHIPNSGEWFQEGLATRFQLQFHPQANYGEIVKGGIANPALRDPLETLTAGGPIGLTRYWQAETLHDLLLRDKDFAAKYPELVAALQASGSTKLAPHLKAVYQLDWPQLEAKWKQHAAGK